MSVASVYLMMMSTGALKALLSKLIAENDERAAEVSAEIARRAEANNG